MNHVQPAQSYFLKVLTSPGKPESEEFYDKVLSLYIQEFGLPFLLKEQALAKDAIKKKLVRCAGSYYRVFEWFFNYYNDFENNPESAFIGITEVKASDYAIYCKGIYWLSCFELSI